MLPNLQINVSLSELLNGSSRGEKEWLVLTKESTYIKNFAYTYQSNKPHQSLIMKKRLISQLRVVVFHNIFINSKCFYFLSSFIPRVQFYWLILVQSYNLQLQS